MSDRGALPLVDLIESLTSRFGHSDGTGACIRFKTVPHDPPAVLKPRDHAAEVTPIKAQCGLQQVRLNRFLPGNFKQ